LLGSGTPENFQKKRELKKGGKGNEKGFNGVDGGGNRTRICVGGRGPEECGLDRKVHQQIGPQTFGRGLPY
jgi:hypothetical protein